MSSGEGTAVDYSWNVTKHDAQEGKWGVNWRMKWVASTLHTTSEHGVSSITTADAHTSAASSRLNWRLRRFKLTLRFAERRNLVSARVPSHFNWPLPTGEEAGWATEWSRRNRKQDASMSLPGIETLYWLNNPGSRVRSRINWHEQLNVSGRCPNGTDGTSVYTTVDQCVGTPCYRFESRLKALLFSSLKIANMSGLHCECHTYVISRLHTAFRVFSCRTWTTA